MVLRLWFWQQDGWQRHSYDGECGKCSGMGKVSTVVLDTELEALTGRSCEDVHQALG